MCPSVRGEVIGPVQVQPAGDGIGRRTKLDPDADRRGDRQREQQSRRQQEHERPALRRRHRGYVSGSAGTSVHSVAGTSPAAVTSAR